MVLKDIQLIWYLLLTNTAPCFMNPLQYATRILPFSSCLPFLLSTFGLVKPFRSR